MVDPRMLPQPATRATDDLIRFRLFEPLTALRASPYGAHHLNTFDSNVPSAAPIIEQMNATATNAPVH